MALGAATPFEAGGAPPGFYIWKSLTEKASRLWQAGELLPQKNCAIETEEWLALLYRAPLFRWNAAALLLQTDIFSAAALWQYSRDAGGFFNNAPANSLKTATEPCIETMRRNSSDCPVSTRRNDRLTPDRMDVAQC